MQIRCYPVGKINNITIQITMKNLIIIIIAIIGIQTVQAQQLDQKTINIIKVKLINAKDLYNKGEYYDALKKIEDIETLSKGAKSAKIQNLKVKCYVGKGSYKSAQRELNVLYDMNPSDNILKDIAAYTDKIEEGVLLLNNISIDDLFFSEGLAAVELNEKWGFINEQRELVLPAIYTHAMFFEEGLASVELDDKWGFINKQGELVIPAIYTYVYYFSEGLTAVKLNEKLGYINKQGELVVPAIYTDADYFQDGLAKVELNGEKFYINKKGERVRKQ